MKVWCLEFKKKNMNNENKLLEYDEVSLIVRDVLQFERVSFGDMWMRIANLLLQIWINRKN